MICESFNYRRGEPCQHKAIALVSFNRMDPLRLCNGHTLAAMTNLEYRPVSKDVMYRLRVESIRRIDENGRVFK